MSMTKKEQRLRRSRQTRARIALQQSARLAVHRSNQHIYASIVSEDGQRVLATASTAEKEVREQLGAAGAMSVAEKAKEVGEAGIRLSEAGGEYAAGDMRDDDNYQGKE